MKISFEIVFPKTTGKSISVFWNFWEAITLRIETIEGFFLGTSIPMVPFPGIGAIIRIPRAERFSAISSCNFLMEATRIPASGTISYKVTVGPTVAFISAIPTLKFFRSPTILFLFSSNSSRLMEISSFP